MKIDLNFFPGFTRKAITFTIDDGNIPLDTKFISIVKPCGIKGTFNLCTTAKGDFTADDFRALYDGYEIANHCKCHPFALWDNQEYTFSEEYYKEGAPTCNGLLYKTENPRLHMEVTDKYWAGKRKVATNENYMYFVREAQDELEAVFGKGNVRGFVWPYGGQPNKVLHGEIANCGLFYGMRTVGSPRENEDFSLPKNRMAWVYNAYHKNILEKGEDFEKYEDDGNLKWFCFGVHSHDFESAGNWCDLEEFARKYGNRPDEFYYATNAEIFDYEDAVKSVVITDTSVYNPSNIDLYIKIDDVNTVLKSGETICF